jgi:predicted alpha/beta-hydrolase family hydrolase
VREVKEMMTSAGPAHVLLEQPERPALLVVLTHGAGGSPDTADVLAVRDAARELGAATALVTQPYRVRGARAPGSAVKQDAAWVELVGALRRETARDSALPLVQCGRSNGARVACRTASSAGAAGVIALAFPLHPPGQPGKSRDRELRGAGTSVLVVNGERDPFGVPEPDEHTEVVILPGETHALSKHPASVGLAVTSWLTALLSQGRAITRSLSPRGEPRPRAVTSREKSPCPRLGALWQKRNPVRRGRRESPWCSGGWCVMVSRTVRGDRDPVWQQLTSVFEDHDPVAEQRPALLRVTRNRVRSLAVGCRRVRTWRYVRAHVSASWLSQQSTVSRHLALWSRSVASINRATSCAPQTPAKWPRPLNLTLPRRAGECKRLADALNRDFPTVDTDMLADWFRPAAS